VRFLKNDRGATAIEYAIIAGTLSIAIVAVVTSIGTSVNSMFASVSTAVK
jgi:pilus assembly protein Flp/PilA